MSAEFPVVDVHGNAYQRGQQHGEALREAIQATFTFYIDELFADIALSREALVARAFAAENLTQRYAPSRLAEINGIAAGSGLAPWQIFLLNARTEILNAKVDECSALFFVESRILAQNWDWVEPLEALCAVIRHHNSEGPDYLSFGEPGMVGKIGFNANGIGVCLNILFAAHGLTGLPVHILIGELLNQADFTSAQHLLSTCGLGKASHLLVAAASGDAISMEYFGEDSYTLRPDNEVLLHTNHCLGLGDAGRTLELANSCKRYDALRGEITGNPSRDLERVKALLSEQDAGVNSILRPYSEQSLLGQHRVGSCASLVMPLDGNSMLVRRGPHPQAPFTTVELPA